ncbi:hypothetical protein MMC34_007244 [Xylographa carneopallida]|nr:hypothetical protein [Xylographa carneopallida]
MLRALLLLVLLSTTFSLAHPADTDPDTDPDAPGTLTRNVYIEFLVNKDKRIRIPPTAPANIGNAGTLSMITVRLYFRNNPSPFANTRTDIGIPYIVNLWALAPHMPQNAVILAPALMEHNHHDSPEAVANNQLGRMLPIRDSNKGLATFRLGSTQLTNEQLLDPATGKGVILDAVADFTAAGGGAQMVLMQKIIDRVAPRRPEHRTSAAQMMQRLFDANMAGYMERTTRYEQLTQQVWGTKVPMISYESQSEVVQSYWVLDPQRPSGLERWGESQGREGVEEGSQVEQGEKVEMAGAEQRAAEVKIEEGEEGVEAGVEGERAEEAEEVEEVEEVEVAVIGEGEEEVEEVEEVEVAVIGEGEEGPREDERRLNK